MLWGAVMKFSLLYVFTSVVGADPVTCPRLEIENAGRIGEASGPYTPRMSVKYECEEGYQMVGHPELICQEHGKWAPVPHPTCMVTCPRPNIKNAIRIGGGSGPYTHRMFVEYKCEEGYQMEGENTLNCRSDGTWYPLTHPTCTGVPCPNLQIENAHVREGGLPPYRYPSVVTYQCDNGYQTTGHASVTCQSSGTWSAPYPECEECVKMQKYKDLQAEKELVEKNHADRLNRLNSLNKKFQDLLVKYKIQDNNRECAVEKELMEKKLADKDRKLQDLEAKKCSPIDVMKTYKVDVTLDPDTAYPQLILSGDGKQVRYGDTRRDVPDNPERFNTWWAVLGKEGFSSGRFYYEVQVKNMTSWWLGVARESVNRKEGFSFSPGEGLWVIWLYGAQYEAGAGPRVLLSLSQQPQKVGVFVDYEQGEVSFYDVDHRSHIYSFTGLTFTEKLYPFFNPGGDDEGKNAAPLVITPVE